MTSFNLKIIALITMIIDHVGGIFFPNHFWIRYIGRLAFPIYAFLISEGLKNTSNIKKYLKNLFILALISELFYDLCFNTSINIFYKTNTVYTLFLASFSIYLYNKYNSYLTLILGLILSYVLHTDYSFLGILLIYIFYFSYSKNQYLCYGIIWVNIKYLNSLTNIIYYLTTKKIYISSDYIINSLGLYIFTIVPFFILYFYNGKKGKNLKYIFYILYPLHLIILYIFKITLL